MLRIFTKTWYICIWADTSISTTNTMNLFDVVIAGAGPAGITSALLLGEAGLKVALIEKSTFPRTKTCGDGITPDIIRQLGLLSPELLHPFTDSSLATPYETLWLTAPNGREVEVPLPLNGDFKSMYGWRRIDLDGLLFSRLSQIGKVKIFQDCRVKSVAVGPDSVELLTSSGTFSAPVVVGADGAASVVARALPRPALSDHDRAFAIRAYFRGLDYGDRGAVPRVIFHRDLLPGYLWIFPFADGTANIGIGMSAAALKQKQGSLERLLADLLQQEPFQQMFRNAVPEGKVRGHFIPLGRNKRIISGQRLLLTGDAAGLAHPLTGEGVGNAIRSGRIAAAHLLDAFEKNDFSASHLLAYDREVYRRMAVEFTNFRQMQQLFSYPWVLNLLARMATPRLIAALTNPANITRLQAKNRLPFRVLYQFLKNR